MAASMISSVASALRSLRLAPFDTSTEAGRSLERDRRIAWTSVSAATAKGSAVLSMLVSVPVTLGYLGPERFGLWMAVSASVAMLHFADLGLSNGLLNAVAHAKGNDDLPAIQDLVANAFIMLCAMAMILAMLFAAAYSVVPWATLFNVASPTGTAEAGTLVLVLMACFLVNLPLGVTQKVQLGLQRGYLANVWESLGSLFGLAGVIVAVSFEAGLDWLALAMAAPPVLARATNAIVFFGWQMPSLRPSLYGFAASTVQRLFRLGSLFFVLQLAVIIGVQSDNLVIARILGAEAVAGYDVAFKLATLPVMLISFIVIAQWPAYGEAASRGDSVWIRHTFGRTLRTGLALALPFAVLFILLGHYIIEFWAGPEVLPSTALLIGMAVWSVLAVIGAVVSALLNGLHVIRFQAITAILFAVTNIMASVYLVGTVGVSGAILGSVLAYVCCTLIPYWFFVRSLLRENGTGRSLGTSTLLGRPGNAE